MEIRVNHPLHRFKADLFKTLGHPARIRILEILRTGERTVSELQAALEIDPSSVSRQLAVLRSRTIVEGRKVGTSVYYHVPDPTVFQLLDVARILFDHHLVGLQALWEEQRQEDAALAAGTPRE